MQFLLSPSNAAGECLPLAGSTGHVDIRLRQKIIVHAVTVEHLPRSLAFDISSAPKDMSIAGFVDAPYLSEHLEERLPRAHQLGAFQYDIEVLMPLSCLSFVCLNPCQFQIHSSAYIFDAP